MVVVRRVGSAKLVRFDERRLPPVFVQVRLDAVLPVGHGAQEAQGLHRLLHLERVVRLLLRLLRRLLRRLVLGLGASVSVSEVVVVLALADSLEVTA